MAVGVTELELTRKHVLYAASGNNPELTRLRDGAGEFPQRDANTHAALNQSGMFHSTLPSVVGSRST